MSIIIPKVTVVRNVVWLTAMRTAQGRGYMQLNRLLLSGDDRIPPEGYVPGKLLPLDTLVLLSVQVSLICTVSCLSLL